MLKFGQLTIQIALLAVTTVSCYAQTFTTVASFTGTNGDQPGGQYGAPMVQGPDGSLYGTTLLGGETLNGLQAGFGVIFKLATNGTLTSLYNLGTGASDGVEPSSGLILGSDGNFYGVDQNTIFKITPGGTFTVLVTPTESSSLNLNGYFNAIIQGTDGNFYGTSGGSNGTVFKMTPSGALTVLYHFTAAGLNLPDTGLVEGSDGNFYGSTENGPNGQAIYKITPQGALTPLALVHANVEGPLIQANDGNFYGVTGSGGAHSNGSVFKMTPAGVLTTLYSFCAQTNCPDGYFPSGGLIQAQDGNLYGVTAEGGAYSRGTIFQLTLGGTLTTLHSFCALLNCTDGEKPQGPLFQASNGTFYGTTVAGGTSPYSYGSVFSLQLNAQIPNAFFTGEASLGSGVYYLQFSDGSPFGYYEFLQGSATAASAWLYHFDLGYEYVTGGDTNGDLYSYDLASGHWWYTSSSLFPYLYDFTLNSWLYYFPATNNPGHYTSNPRSFSNLTTGKIITM